MNTTRRTSAAVVALGLVLTTAGCQGAQKPQTFVAESLAPVAAEMGTNRIRDLSFSVDKNGNSDGGLSATFASGTTPKDVYVFSNKKKKPQISDALISSVAAKDTVDYTTLDLSPYVAKAQQYSKDACKGEPADVALQAIAPEKVTASISCGRTDLHPQLLVDGQPSPVPNPGDPAATVTAFFDYVKAVGGPRVDGIFVLREDTGAFSISWRDDAANTATDLAGKKCQRELAWRAPKEGEKPYPLLSSCQVAAGTGGAIEMAQLNPAGLAKVIQSAGSAYWIQLHTRDGVPRWGAQSSPTATPILYDVDGNQVKN